MILRFLKSVVITKISCRRSLEQRNSSSFNFFTLWMGTVHHIPNYIAVRFFTTGIITVSSNSIPCYKFLLR
ncbi:hypothetical protein BTA30_12965 [Bacillus swezeyi]|uniref:Uncharacterized protein n=1 Tax=Bacillus swezeyi TaxID=1925020 RepID=A0A1R1RW66_9BACI|nr:hypothetical protein BW143_08905 [Bacillus swezeyi]OMI30266.1 hypothetical protein BTA30_12965 [Bacillus swezeyi]